MIDKLIPWKKWNGDLKVHHDEHPISRLRSDFNDLWDRLLDDFDGGLSDGNGSQMLGSDLDFGDDENEYVLRAALPGFEPADIDVKVSGNVLTIKAEHKEEGKAKNSRFHRYGSFFETFTLPKGVESAQIDANYHSGVLELRMPKSEEWQGKRIEVKSA